MTAKQYKIAVKSYKVIKPFIHHNKRQSVDSVVELNSRQSVYLLTSGFIKLIKPDKKSNSKS